MSDTRVAKLIYRVIAGKDVDFNNAKPLEVTYPEFALRVEDDVATFTLNVDVSTVEDGQAIVRGFIDAWQLSSGLEGNTDDFMLEYDDAERVERNPVPGTTVLCVGTARIKLTVMPVRLHVSRLAYPRPPTNLRVSELVAAMYYQYKGFREGKIPLSMVGYFCLTAVEYCSGLRSKKRPDAARILMVDIDVLCTLGNLTGEAGGREARKAEGRSTLAMMRPYTEQEKEWIIQVVKLLIRRVAEYEADPNGPLAQITYDDLPPLVSDLKV